MFVFIYFWVVVGGRGVSNCLADVKSNWRAAALSVGPARAAPCVSVWTVGGRLARPRPGTAGAGAGFTNFSPTERQPQPTKDGGFGPPHLRDLQGRGRSSSLIYLLCL